MLCIKDMALTDSKETIVQSSTLCRRSLEQLLNFERLCQDGWAETRLADLDLWIANTGACTEGRASLDARLSIRPQSRKIIINLLSFLKIATDKCAELVAAELQENPKNDHRFRGRPSSPSSSLQPSQRSFSPWSDGSDSSLQAKEESLLLSMDDTLEGERRYVELLIKQLAQTGMSIKQSGRRSRLQRADQLFKADLHEDLRSHLTTILLARSYAGSTDLRPDAITDIQRRLILCNLKRRNRFLYAQQHTKSYLPTPSSIAQQAQVESSIADAPKLSAKIEEAAHLDNLVRDDGKAQPENSISTLSDSFAISEIPPVKPTASTVLSVALRNTLDYPKPPRIENKLILNCPCCCEPLSEETFQGSKWKKHIKGDLSPYTCILPHCNNPYETYPTQESWEDHLLEDHSSNRYWVCLACDDGVEYYEKDSFDRHIETDHVAHIPLEKLPLLASSWMRSIPNEIKTCPICGWPEDEKREVDRQQILNHIAEHTHSFSLLSLPWADNEDKESEVQIKKAHKKVNLWLSGTESISSPESSSKTRYIELDESTSKSTKADPSGYFRTHQYFTLDAESSSSDEAGSLNSREQTLEKWKAIDLSLYLVDQHDDWDVGSTSVLYPATFSDPFRSIYRALGKTGCTISQVAAVFRAVFTFLNGGLENKRALSFQYRRLSILSRCVGAICNDANIRVKSRSNSEVPDSGDFNPGTPDPGVSDPEVSSIGFRNESRSGSLYPHRSEALFADQNRLEEVEAIYTRALEGKDKALGQEHTSTLDTVNDLGNLYRDQGRLIEAGAMYERALAGREKVLGEEHPDTLTSIINLASIYNSQGRWKETEELEVKVLEARRRVLGEEHPDTLTSINNLASIYNSKGRWKEAEELKVKEAEELKVKVLEARRRVLGEEHPDTLTSINDLASIYNSKGRWKEAEELKVKVLDAMRRVLGEEHPDTLTSIINLASIYNSQGRWKETEELEVKVLEARRRVLGEEHPDTLTSINNLASIYNSQGRWKEAGELKVKVLEARRRVLGEEYPDTLRSRNDSLDIQRLRDGGRRLKSYK